MSGTAIYRIFWVCCFVAIMAVGGPMVGRPPSALPLVDHGPNSSVNTVLEQTLAREVFEEVGIQVENVRYFGSQPWPFPHSLMVGFFADYAGGEIVVDGQEILDARWFAAHALPEVPPKLSIARQLIDAWLAEVAPRG